MDIMTAKDFKEEVKYLLETKGWTKGTFQNDEGAFCLSGAIRTIRNRHAFSAPYSWQAYCEVNNEIMLRLRALGFPYNSIPTWNDLPTTTFDDVLRVLE